MTETCEGKERGMRRSQVAYEQYYRQCSNIIQHKAGLRNTHPLNWDDLKEQQLLDQKNSCHFSVRKQRVEVLAAKTDHQGVGVICTYQ